VGERVFSDFYTYLAKETTKMLV